MADPAPEKSGPFPPGLLTGLIVPTWPNILEESAATGTTAVKKAMGDIRQAWGRCPPDLILTVSPFWVGETSFFVEAGAHHRARTDYHGYNADLSYSCPGDPAFADTLVRRGQAAGISVTAHAHWPDVASTVPLQLLFPDQKIPLVPLSSSELPLNQALAWGRVIRQTVAASGKRVLFLCGGGLSHNLTACMHWEDSIAAVIFDQKVLHCLTSGQGTEVRHLDPYWVQVGNPPAGFSDLFIFLGAVGETRPWRLLAYDGAPGVGWAVLE